MITSRRRGYYSDRLRRRLTRGASAYPRTKAHRPGVWRPTPVVQPCEPFRAGLSKNTVVKAFDDVRASATGILVVPGRCPVSRGKRQGRTVHHGAVHPPSAIAMQLRSRLCGPSWSSSKVLTTSPSASLCSRSSPCCCRPRRSVARRHRHATSECRQHNGPAHSEAKVFPFASTLG